MFWPRLLLFHTAITYTRAGMLYNLKFHVGNAWLIPVTVNIQILFTGFRAILIVPAGRIYHFIYDQFPYGLLENIPKTYIPENPE